MHIDNDKMRRKCKKRACGANAKDAHADKVHKYVRRIDTIESHLRYIIQERQQFLPKRAIAATLSGRGDPASSPCPQTSASGRFRRHSYCKAGYE